MRFLPLPILLLVIFLAQPALADIYKWTDDRGGVNYTDKLDNVPEKYRSRVKVFPSKKEQKPAGKASGAAESSPSERLYGGHDADWWRASFASLRDEIKELQDNLPKKREELARLHREYVLHTYARKRLAYEDKNAEIRKDEDRIKDLNNRLAALDAEASRAAVPLEWRR